MQEPSRISLRNYDCYDFCSLSLGPWMSAWDLPYWLAVGLCELKKSLYCLSTKSWRDQGDCALYLSPPSLSYISLTRNFRGQPPPSHHSSHHPWQQTATKVKKKSGSEKSQCWEIYQRSYGGTMNSMTWYKSQGWPRKKCQKANH